MVTLNQVTDYYGVWEKEVIEKLARSGGPFIFQSSMQEVSNDDNVVL